MSMSHGSPVSPIAVNAVAAAVTLVSNSQSSCVAGGVSQWWVPWGLHKVSVSFAL